jgi:prepilin-type N-terminal cleavage/methylation domain-containing protein
MARKSAYTLVELLIASTIFASVAVLATATLAGTFRLLRVSRETHDVGAQGQAALSVISQDVASAVGTPAIRTLTLGDTHLYGVLGENAVLPDDGLIAINVPKRDVAGAILAGQTEVHVYCSELQSPDSTALTITGKRLTRYVLGGTDLNAFASQASGNRLCTPAGIKELFGLAGFPIGQYLTEGPVRAISLRFWSIWSDQSSAPAAYDVDAPGVRMELAVRYFTQNVLSADAPEARVNDSSYLSPQLVLRYIALRGSLQAVPGNFGQNGSLLTAPGGQGSVSAPTP